MGLFDGFEAGWNSFKNNELKAFTGAVEDASKPIWEREAGKKILGEDNAQKITDAFNQTVIDSPKPIWEREAGKEILGEDNAQKITDAFNQAVEDSSKPIWEREAGKEILGEDNAQKITDTLNPDNWDIIPTEAVDTVKKYLPAVLLGGAALFLISALK